MLIGGGPPAWEGVTNLQLKPPIQPTPLSSLLLLAHLTPIIIINKIDSNCAGRDHLQDIMGAPTEETIFA